MTMTTLRIAAASAALAFTAFAGPALAADPPLVTPEVAEAFKADMRAYVDRGNAPGIITTVIENGEVVLEDAYGVANVPTGTPMAVDTPIRIASLTKVITSVAALMLVEEGKISLDAPVAQYIPEFADLKVLDDAGNLVPPAHAPTIRELMTHTGGFVYGLNPNHPADQAYQAANVLDPTTNMDVMIGKLATIPLKHQPGTAWEYSVGADILGAVIERASGEPFADFLQTRLFDPLNMDDTGFALSPEAAARAAALHAPNPDGEGFVAFGAFADADPTVVPSLPSGGGGLWSTVEDYAPFLQMLMNGGELDGVRYLKPETVELIVTDQLPDGLTATASVRQAGFGLGLAIAADQSVSGQALPGGTITWPGIYGVYWWADPANDLIVFTVMQVMVTTARGKENLGEVGPASLYGLIAE